MSSALIDYMDPDVAYLFGMVLGRGTLLEDGQNRLLVIEIEFNTLEAQGITKVFDNRRDLALGIMDVRERINELLEVELRQRRSKNTVRLTARFSKNTIGWRNLKLLTQGKTSYRQFTIPDFLMDAPPELKSEMIRGLADVAGYIRLSNRDQAGLHRVYIQINNGNWLLPIQVCRILQQDLGVPVRLIQWGHPNTREPTCTDVSADHTGWAREHQIKIYAHDFQKVGFSFSFKREILDELAQYNIERKGAHQSRFCDPRRKKVRKIKAKHPCEGSDRLPPELRGRHFDSYWQICKRLGCTQRFEQPQPELPGFEEEEEEE